MIFTKPCLTFSLMAVTSLVLSACNPGTTATSSSAGGSQSAGSGGPSDGDDAATATAAMAEVADAGAVTASPAPSAGVDSPPDGANTTSGGAEIDAGTAILSPENTTIQFVGTHVGDKPDPRTGVFMKFAGTASIDPASNALQAVSVEIDTASLLTPIDKLTNHLKSQDFFDVREYPTARFESTQIVPAEGGEGNYVVTGNLTLLKTTKEVSFPAQVRISDRGLGLDAKLTIDRAEYKLGVGQDRVNKEVEISVWVGKKTSPPAG